MLGGEIFIYCCMLGGGILYVVICLEVGRFYCMLGGVFSNIVVGVFINCCMLEVRIFIYIGVLSSGNFI